MFQPYSWTHVLFMLGGLGLTVGLAAIALVGGAVAGGLLTVLRLASHKAPRTAARFYIFVVQGTPLIVLLFIAYFGARAGGLDVGPVTAIAVAFSLYAAAFLADIWRGAIEAVPAGQREAAAALGLGALPALRLVIAPQAVRIATAPTVGFFVQLVKNTSLASVVGIVELTRTAQIVSNATFKPLDVYGTAAGFYFVVCFPLTLLSRFLERRLAAERKGS